MSGRPARPTPALSRDPLGSCLFCGGRPEDASLCALARAAYDLAVAPEATGGGAPAGGEDHGVGCCRGAGTCVLAVTPSGQAEAPMHHDAGGQYRACGATAGDLCLCDVETALARKIVQALGLQRTRPVRCAVCTGDGFCNGCQGDGRVLVRALGSAATCPDCGGSGNCPECDGTGCTAGT